MKKFPTTDKLDGEEYLEHFQKMKRKPRQKPFVRKPKPKK